MPLRLAVDIAPKQAPPPAFLSPDLRRIRRLQGQRDARQRATRPSPATGGNLAARWASTCSSGAP
ncbi:hypothetical protein FQS62_015885 [Stenotrophomonas sp. SBJS02]|uniref:hypothetical protein n=1 Tax=Stenotrophomonas sp. SBJS02 TaxID=2599307 RepID=UPI001CF10FB7|nr:hypothetical protein [Stenotrophomonas sp. SBJS02]WAP00797.1 hypothetical protein FQS62_015885 [Stenotrophomonas sp. SBJS02]